MKKLSIVAFFISITFSGLALSLETKSADLNALSKAREAEINDFSQRLKSETGAALLATADLITGSGISDLGLLKEVEVVLDKVFTKHVSNRKKDKRVAEELHRLLRTHASFGSPTSLNYINKTINQTKKAVRTRARRLKPKVSWFKERNSIMQQADHYEALQHIMTHRYINLILSNNYSVRRWGLEELSRQENAEPIVFETMRKVLKNEMLQIQNDLHLDSLAWICKTLARSDA
ncbi:MAG: hypothetical protein COA42_24525, partial [Alteromonadaceae bacterium]